MKHLLYLVLAIAIINISPVNAQEENSKINAITTAAPFLLITPDARAGGMGDVGVATSPDFNNQHHNAAKSVFNSHSLSIGLNFTPWLNKLANDVYLGSVTANGLINERSAWTGEFKYFTLGEIQLTDINGENIKIVKPNEFALGGSYALKLNEVFAMGVGIRFLRSDFSLEATTEEFRTINSFAFDLSGYYQSDEKNFGTFDGIIRGGFNISNIGPKVSYIDGGRRNFIPTNLKLGAGFDFILDQYNVLGVTLETNKLLVPTPPNDLDDDIGFVEGMFTSFGDAPGGFSEEMQEFTWALGSEYLYNDIFALRAGYFHESKTKGARQFFTVGAGIEFNAVNIDVSYLFNASDINNPLENALRFSVGFNLGQYTGY